MELKRRIGAQSGDTADRPLSLGNLLQSMYKDNLSSTSNLAVGGSCGFLREQKVNESISEGAIESYELPTSRENPRETGEQPTPPGL